MNSLFNRASTLLLITFIIISGIVYLGYRTIAHEALLRHYQEQQLAQSRIAQVELFINNLLGEKSAKFNALASYLNLDNEDDIRALKEADVSMDNIFILYDGNLLYPNEQEALSLSDQAWLRMIKPIIHDHTLLYNHIQIEEGNFVANSRQRLPVRSGWFTNTENEQTLLIYWYEIDDKIIGLKVSYIELLHRVINSLNVNYSPDALTIKENDRLLYQSGDESLIDRGANEITYSLSHPLVNWRISYYTQGADLTSLWLSGVLILIFAIALLAFIAYRVYSEYQRSMRLARQQVSFVGQVSHELKTPLTNISLYAEILKDEPYDEESSAPRYLDVIISETQRLSRLIQNILSFTKTPKTHFKTFNLTDFLKQIHQTFLPAFEAKQMKFHLSADREISITSDIDRLTQIISNFLSNAEKYASQGKKVDLSSEQDERFITIRVRDYGEGIANRELKNIFRPFYRIKSSITEGVSGTGIGLTIAQQLAQNLQGKISVENCSPGAAFILTLPCVIKIEEDKQ